MFERVYTCGTWYGGPRVGVADYRGLPHFLDSEWSDLGVSNTTTGAATFLLRPVDAAMLPLALEDGDIWQRQETAFHQGLVTVETHLALPEKRGRQQAWAPRLKDRKAIESVCAFRQSGEFRAWQDDAWNPLGFASREVRRSESA